MDVRVGDSQRCKRKLRSEEDERWECSVCTYINPSESYKCEMCYMRKGTSTRKPRLNPQVVEQQQLIAQAILKEKDEDHRRRKEMKPNSLKMDSASSLKPNNIDRSSSLLFKVFANGYSVVITEFQLKPPLKSNSLDSPVTSNCSSLQSLTGVLSTNSEQFSPADSTHASSDRTGNLEAFTEYELTDSPNVKVLRTSGSKLTSGVGTSNFEAVPHSISSSSSFSHGYNDPSCSNSTPNSRHPSPVHVKPEPQMHAADAEQACKTCASDDAIGSDENTVIVKDTREPGSDSKQPIARVPLRPLRSATGRLSMDVKAEAKHSLKKRRSLRENSTAETPGLRSGYPAKSLCDPEVFPTALGLTAERKRGRGQRISDVSKPSYTVHQKSLHASTSVAPISPSPSWTSNRESRDSKGLSLRISVNSRSGAKTLQSESGHRSGDLRHETLPARDRPPQAKKRRHSGAQRTGLKCKIRVLHTSSPEEPDSRVITYSTSPSVSLMLEQKDSDVEASGEPFASLVASCGGETCSGALNQRLSTESKNTSAMTDSSGANALEISH